MSVTVKPIELPWPDRALHPNARVHWAVKARATKTARRSAATIAWAQGWHRIAWPDGDLEVRIDAWPPNRRAHDRDGIQSALKPALDGVADIMGVNDSRFIPRLTRHDDVVPGGRILIEIVPMAKEAA